MTATLGALGIAAFGVVVGVLSGLIGVGGGVIMVPFMTGVLGFPQHLAQGTSLVALLPISAVGAATHVAGGNVQPRAAAAMAALGVVGVVAGSLLALHLPSPVLVRVFGAFLLFSAYRIGRPALWPARRASAAPPDPG